MSTETRPAGKTMRELRRIVADDNARFDELADAWPNLTTDEQEFLLKWARYWIAREPRT